MMRAPFCVSLLLSLMVWAGCQATSKDAMAEAEPVYKVSKLWGSYGEVPETSMSRSGRAGWKI
jgi:hypothetical protein